MSIQLEFVQYKEPNINICNIICLIVFDFVFNKAEEPFHLFFTLSKNDLFVCRCQNRYRARVPGDYSSYEFLVKL